MLARSFLLLGLLALSSAVEAKKKKHHHHKTNKLVKHSKHRKHHHKAKASAASSPVAAAPVSPVASPVSPVASPAPVAANATKPASNTTSSALSGSGLSGKRGVGFTNGADTKLFQHASWAYDWNNGEAAFIKPGQMYFPMLWGQKQVSNWQQNANAAIASGSKYLLGMNEPDGLWMHGGFQQANLSPGDAAALWKSQMQPFAGKAKLISPAVTNGVGTAQAPMGLTWLEQFLTACTGCTIDGFALHIYAQPDMSYWTSYLMAASQKLGKPIWLTEIGLAGASGASDESQIAFLKQLMPWLESQSFIAGYAWFGAFRGGSGTMVNSGGTALTDIGQVYDA